VYSSLLQHLVPPEEADARNVVLEVRVGVGGEWAGAFAMDLLRMYQGFCEQQGWQFEVSCVCAGALQEGPCNGVPAVGSRWQCLLC
jgi:protein subunit release factor A